METVIQASTLQTQRAGLRGTAHASGEEGYEEASRAWNLAVHQSPALVVVANGAADVMAAVRFAQEGELGVGVMATGHGVGAACDGGVLINTPRHLRQLYGARWRERREGEGRLRDTGFRAPRRPKEPLRPAERLPLQS